MQLGLARRRAREVGERREHAQRLLDRARDQRRVVEQLLLLAGVLQQRPHAAAVGRLGAVVAGGHQQEEAHDDLVLLEALALELGVDQHAGEVVGRVRTALLDQRAAALEDLGHLALHDALGAIRVEVGVAAAERGVHQPRPDLVVLGPDAHEAADDARDDRLRDVGDEIAGLAAFEPVEHGDRDLADRVLVVGDALGREASLEQRLEPVVLGRIHPDEHRLDQLERHDRVAQERDPADLGGVGLPVAADLVDVLGLGDRPVALFGGVLGDLVGPVHRALVAKLLEGLVRWAVLPHLALGYQHALQVIRRHHGLRGRCA